ncbi:hypothetical protein QO004_003372 [Rhizobium mesoamericanum]|uniref:hypothetical protein n=1 Tax=Rhizobium mesoamericanum TaxID=1079800 RepID=UPI002783286E|nr:hypothetical protein [Rhizobium mesoamericanum]MDQ0561578.1 hypothetical protein [Rhizobium mesoamericanum]
MRDLDHRLAAARGIATLLSARSNVCTAGIVDEHVDATEALLGGRDRRLDL